METCSLSKQINQQRKDKGLTSEQLADICDVNPVHIRKIESGASLPSIALFIKLCNALKTSADLVLGDLLDKPVVPDCVEQLGKRLNSLTPGQLEVIGKIVAVMIRYSTQMVLIDKNTLGRRISQLRAFKGLTSSQLAERCDVSPAHIRQIESDGGLPSFILFVKICNALETSADFLLGDLLDNPAMPDCVEQLGNQFKHLTPVQIGMIGEMAEIMIEHITKESDENK